MKIIWHTLKQNPILTAILLFVTVIFVAAWAAGLSSSSAPYDKIVHFLLPAVGGLLLYAALAKRDVLPLFNSRVSRALIIALLGTAIEVVWEIIEFAVESTFGVNIQYGNVDTMVDLIMAVAGSSLVGMWYAFHPHLLTIKK